MTKIDAQFLHCVTSVLDRYGSLRVVSHNGGSPSYLLQLEYEWSITAYKEHTLQCQRLQATPSSTQKPPPPSAHSRPGPQTQRRIVTGTSAIVAPHNLLGMVWNGQRQVGSRMRRNRIGDSERRLRCHRIVGFVRSRTGPLCPYLANECRCRRGTLLSVKVLVGAWAVSDLVWSSCETMTAGVFWVGISIFNRRFLREHGSGGMQVGVWKIENRKRREVFKSQKVQPLVCSCRFGT